jgi:hypothetical protein
MNSKHGQEMCCTECGETDEIVEYHMAGWSVNADYQPTPPWGGLDYPTEYIWCGNCEEETNIEPYNQWHERTTNEE